MINTSQESPNQTARLSLKDVMIAFREWRCRGPRGRIPSSL